MRDRRHWRSLTVRSACLAAALVFVAPMAIAIQEGPGGGLNGFPFHTSPRIDVPAATSASTRNMYAHLLEKPFLVGPGMRITCMLQYNIVASTGVNDTYPGTFRCHVIEYET